MPSPTGSPGISGHEDYQEIKGVQYPMDERVLIAEILEEEGIKISS